MKNFKLLLAVAVVTLAAGASQACNAVSPIGRHSTYTNAKASSVGTVGTNGQVVRSANVQPGSAAP